MWSTTRAIEAWQWRWRFSEKSANNSQRVNLFTNICIFSALLLFYYSSILTDQCGNLYCFLSFLTENNLFTSSSLTCAHCYYHFSFLRTYEMVEIPSRNGVSQSHKRCFRITCHYPQYLLSSYYWLHLSS